MKRNILYKYFNVIQKMTVYNLKIIFANRFFWFLIGSVGFYLGLSLIYILSNNIYKVQDLYGTFIFTGILLVFYPSVFGIQNDQDSRTIEILFGIPDYRYKVWLIRLLMIFIITFLVMLVYTSISSLLIIKFRILEMTSQVMLPVMFIGTLAFMMSTVVRNGNGTAVIMIVIGIFFLILSDNLSRSQWNIFLNPYDLPRDMNETAWNLITVKNRIILTTGIILCLLAGLYNLQKREKFI